MNKKLLIFDGTSIAAESYYQTLTSEVEAIKALKESGKTVTQEEEELAYKTLLQAKKGVYINAVQGFFTKLLDALDKTKPSHLLVTWGAERENNFRRKIFSGYKDDGKVKDNALLQQEKLIKSILKNLGIHQITGFEYESLDIAGTVAEKFKSEMEVEIYARNVQSLQFTDIATVWFKIPNYKDVIKAHNLDSYEYPDGTVKFDEAFLYEYKNIRPYQIPDYRALIGNSFSKVPGIKSVGQVTTTKLLEEYDSLENLYLDIDSCADTNELIKFGKELTSCLMLAFNPIEFLVKDRDKAFLGKELATYKRDISNSDIDNLKENSLLLSNINKTDIIRELKNINLSPIKCKLTAKINSTIESMGFKCLIIAYNPFILSPKSEMFIPNITSLEDEIPVIIEVDGETVRLIQIEDDTILFLHDKIKVDLSSCEYYSIDNIQTRFEERRKAYEERKASSESSTPHSNTTIVLSELKSNNINTTTERYTEISEGDNCVVTIVETDDNNLDANNNSLDTAIELEGEVEIKDVVELDLDEELEVDLKSQSNDETTNVTTDNTVKNDLNNKNINESKPNNILNLIDSFTINRYHCNNCNSDFMLVGDTASFCTHCGSGVR